MKPTYQDCLKIVENCDNFYEKVDYVNGHKISIFNYIISILDFFKKPIPNDSSLNAFELRGITFIHYPNETKRYLMLHKFLNLNEGPGFLYDDLKDWKVIRLQQKADGSMIRFIRLPDGSIIPKTKNGLNNDQTKMAKEVYENSPKLQEFIKDTLDHNLSAIFELTSPFNQIVCIYDTTELTLIQLREESSGTYLDIYNNDLVKNHSIKTVKQETLLTLDELLKLKDTVENTEGWIVTLTNGIETKLVKIKTKWYMDRFKMIEKAVVENTLIELILDEQIDDAMAVLDPTSEYHKYCTEVRDYFSNYLSQEVHNIIEFVKTFDGDRKAFALKNLKHPLFNIGSSFLGSNPSPEDVLKRLKIKIKKETYHLMKARAFLKDIGFKSNIKLSVKDE